MKKIQEEADQHRDRVFDLEVRIQFATFYFDFMSDVTMNNLYFINTSFAALESFLTDPNHDFPNCFS